ncbi:hypothetical protein [Mycobacterium avium]|uniref:hypothetical protein n=1 Tax=Mycobacterium avium TaxID=1764 RepID=UPI000213AB0B|nr:hypothetical protein [Mycobacterium avium]QPM72999.1 hypothetical protein MAPS_19860 [Mycobacterium avium subsp. paratuberculosis S397]
MDVVLGVAVTGPVARLALVGSRGTDVIDQSVVDLADNPIETLTETVVGTNRLLAGENHRLVGTRLCWTDHPRADQLRRALEDSGVHNVAVLSESQAVAALMRAAGQPGAALVMDDATGTLSMVSPAAGDPDAPPTLLARQPLGGAVGGDVTAALQTMMANLSAHPDAPGEVYLVGASPDLDRVAEQLRDASTMRVQVADDPTFALARGAAIAAAPALAAGDATAMAPAVGVTGDATAMAPAAGDATAMAPAAGLTGDETTVVPAPELAEPQDRQLAYSMADDAGIYPGEMDEYDPEFDDYDADYDDGEEAAPAKLSRRSLVIGNAVIAFAVIGLASLATAIAVAVEPTASRQPVVGVQNGTPGKFMPILPSQQQAPLPPPPADAPNAGFQGGVVQAPSNASAPQPAVPAPANPAPEAPSNPGVVPNPNPGWAPNPNLLVPVPIPIPVPIPGWNPPYNPPYTPPYNPTTPYTPPTTTYEPPTTTYQPPTTTYQPPTTTYQPPTTTYQPPTTTYQPPTTTHEPPTTTYQPPSTRATTEAPLPTHTQQTVPPTHSQPLFPQEPHTHRGF